MGVALTKDSIDLGIVITDAEASLGVLPRRARSSRSAGEMALPGGGTMYRLMCGTSMIKLIKHPSPPPAVAAPGGIPAATGYRYFTISVSNIDEITDACAAAGPQGRVCRCASCAPGMSDLDGRGPRRQLGRVPAGRLSGTRLVQPAAAAVGRRRSPIDRRSRAAIESVTSGRAGASWSTTWPYELRDLGVGQDDMVTIALPNSVDWFVAFAAAWRLGAIPQPISSRLPPREIDAIIELADPGW